MKMLLVALMLFNQGNLCSKQDLPSIRISVVSQKKFRNRGHHPENNRKVIFRVVNESSKPVFIYGFKYDGEFDPTGYMMVLNRDKNEWEYPNPDNSSTNWSDVPAMEKDKSILKPGESITIDAEMSELEVGSHFRRTVYASYNENDEPCEVRGEEFVLKQGCVVPAKARITTHSTGAAIARLSSERLKACSVDCRPVNSSVRLLIEYHRRKMSHAK